MADKTYRNFMKLEVLMHKSCVVLRQAFRERWKTFKGEEWVDGRKSGSDFMEIFGKRLFFDKSHSSFQKKNVEQGNTNFWSIPTLCKILLEVDFGQEIINENERKLLHQLRNVRNELASHPTQIFSAEEFNENWNEISDVLVYFGYSIDALEEICLAENIGNIDFQSTKHSLKNDIEASQLRDEGNKAFKEGDFDKAFQLYTKAIVLPEISDYILAFLYANRVAVYLKRHEEMPQSVCASDSNLQNAKEDAKKAVQLHPTWWKVHFRMGCVYQKSNKFKKAIHSFNQALSLDPSQQSVKLAKEFCQQKFEAYDRNECFDSTNIASGLHEKNEKLIQEGLQKLKETSREELEEKLRKKGDPLADVWQAHRYRDGVGVPQNYELAAKLYTKAASKGNAEGMYNLALLTKHGKGVKRDIMLAIELFKQAAAQPLVNCFGLPNVGVAEAEYELGLLYMEDVGFDYDPFQAFAWYERASSHGCGNASHNLGCMYSKGIGVNRNSGRAVQYWKLATTQKNILSMESLAYHYLEDKQPEIAKKWFERAMENGSKIQKEEFEALVVKVTEDVEKCEVVVWEKEHGLTVQNLTFEERLLRMTHALDPSFSKFFEFFCDFMNRSNQLPYQTETKQKFDLETLKIFAENGSKTAIAMFRAVTHFFEGLTLLENGNENDAIRHIAEGFRIEHIVAPLNESIKYKLIKIIKTKLKDGKCSDPDLERDLHVCYGFLRANNLEETITFVNGAIKKFPRESCLYDLYANLHGFLKKYEEGFMIASKGVSLFPADIELRYTKAASRALLENASTADKIRHYVEFLELSPADHRKVPDCYYGIAACYFEMETDEKPSSECDHLFSMVNKYYKLGLAAEEKQLPFFMPYSSAKKSIVQELLELRKLVKAKEAGKGTEEKCAKKSTVENSCVERKLFNLTDPFRIHIVVVHREFFFKLRKEFCATTPRFKLSSTVQPKHKQTIPLQLTGLKPIMLEDMDPAKDKVYNGYVLQVTSIEDALTGMASVILVVEDKNGDVQRCCVYNFEQDEEVQEKLGYGCKISIINPYMRQATDGRSVIRADVRESLILHPEKSLNRCRFCGATDATKKCSRCLRAVYCSKECQKQDWKLLKHKLICVKKVALPTCSGADITFS